MHKVTIFPLGNADTTRIDLENGEKLLIDFADVHNPDDDSDKRIDLTKELRNDLDEHDCDSYDVVAFTHVDHDHIAGSSDFFHLRHAEKYQGDDRIKINIMWVPAAAILEESQSGDARVVRQEARYRLKKGEGIRVFSTPGRLDEWLEDQGIDPSDRRHLFVDAGECIPEFSLSEDGFEVFVHSPHATRSNDGELINRNEDALGFQATFLKGGHKTRMHFFSDLGYEVIEDIVRITEYHERDERLEWDLFHLSHHSSYKSLAEEKGQHKTNPADRVKTLFEKHSNDRARMISTSKPIPTEDTEQPPHRQAANYYREVAEKINGEYKVTMEHPSTSKPKPIIIEIDDDGSTLRKDIGTGVGPIGSSSAPRAGGK